MALIKQVELETGLVATYWKVTIVRVEAGLNALVYVSLFKDTAARQAGKTPVKVDIITVSTSSDFISTEKNAIERAYEYLKLRPEFSGAADA